MSETVAYISLSKKYLVGEAYIITTWMTLDAAVF